jgi:hypothetical protein
MICHRLITIWGIFIIECLKPNFTENTNLLEIKVKYLLYPFLNTYITEMLLYNNDFIS